MAAFLTTYNERDNTWSGAPRSSIYDYDVSAGRVIFANMKNWPNNICQVSARIRPCRSQCKDSRIISILTDKRCGWSKGNQWTGYHMGHSYRTVPEEARTQPQGCDRHCCQEYHVRDATRCSLPDEYYAFPCSKPHAGRRFDCKINFKVTQLTE